MDEITKMRKKTEIIQMETILADLCRDHNIEYIKDEEHAITWLQVCGEMLAADYSKFWQEDKKIISFTIPGKTVCTIDGIRPMAIDIDFSGRHDKTRKCMDRLINTMYEAVYGLTDEDALEDTDDMGHTIVKWNPAVGCYE